VVYLLIVNNYVKETVGKTVLRRGNLNNGKSIKIIDRISYDREISR